jgi:hypothetical protein
MPMKTIYMCECVCTYIRIYIYIYIKRERTGIIPMFPTATQKYGDISKYIYNFLLYCKIFMYLLHYFSRNPLTVLCGTLF